MGVSHSTARWLAPSCFLFNFAAQQYGIFSTPSMKDINDRNVSFWSPHPYFIGAFFSMQQIFQLAYLYKLWKLDPNIPSERAELAPVDDYAPIFSLGNLCIGTWMIFWNSEQLKVSNIFVIINSLSQLYHVFGRLEPMNTNSTTSVLTHIVAKTFAGIGVLDLVHNGSVAYFKDALPSTTIKVATALGFGMASAAGDWIFGGCMVYDLLAIAVGQSGRDAGWRNLLAAYAVGAAGIVGAKNLVRPPYDQERNGYAKTATEDIQDRV